MSQPSESSSSTLTLRVPAAVLRIWIDDSATDPDATRSEIGRFLLGQSGIYEVGPLLFAVVPETDPALFDTALFWCRRLPEALRGDPTPVAAPLRMLVWPGEVVVGDQPAQLVPDAFSADLEEKPPELVPDQVHLSRWASYQLEQPWRFQPALDYEGPSGRSLPIVRAESPSFAPTPWRNPELLSRRLKTVDRPHLVPILESQLEHPALRLHGPIGCGKSRIAWHTLRQREALRLWLRAAPARRREAPLLQQILQQLLEPAPPQEEDHHHPRLIEPEVRDDLLKIYRAFRAGAVEKPAPEQMKSLLLGLERLAAISGKPVYLVCDDLEQIDWGDLDFLSRLLAAPQLGSAYRLLLIGRSGGEVPSELLSLESVEIPPFNEKEMGNFATQIFTGLSLPRPVQDRLLTATRGYPFALEEAMIALVRDQSVRRIHGSFFYQGDEDEDFRPSLRLICHLQAEAARLRQPAPLYLLSLIRTGAPAADVAAAAVDRPDSATEWEKPALESGLLSRIESPWGAGVTVSCPAFNLALARTIHADSIASARRRLGEVLLDRSESGEAYWEAYQLLKGSPQAIPPLLEALKTPYAARLGRDEVHAALTRELEEHRQRNGDDETELELLWSLLPLARRMGKLHQHTESLDRGVKLATGQPRRLLALAGVKAEIDTESGRYKEAESTILAALKATQGTDPRRQALLMLQLGRLFLRQERFQEAARLFGNLELALSHQGSPALIANCQFHLGNIALHQRLLEDAQKFHEAALEKRRAQGLLRPTGFSLCALGSVLLARGDYPQGLAYYHEAREILEENGRDVDQGYALLGLGRAWSRLGDFSPASKLLRQALEIRQGRDDKAGEAIARLAVAENYLYLGQPDAALDEARQASFHFSLLSLPSRLADTDQLLGRIRLSQRQYGEAERHLVAALDRHRNAGNRFAAGFDLGWLLELAILTERVDDVRRYTADLRQLIATRDQAELAEQLDFRLYRGLVWLEEHGHKVGDPMPYLERAYREILRSASGLEPELRHRFLFQVPDNLEIIETASRRGLAPPSQASA